MTELEFTEEINEEVYIPSSSEKKTSDINVYVCWFTSFYGKK